MLSDSNKRRQFDSYGSTRSPGSSYGPSASKSGFKTSTRGPIDQNYSWSYTSSMDPEELFRSVFGNFGSARASGSSIFDSIINAMYNEPKHYQLTVDFLEAVQGVTKSFQIDEAASCSTCGGRGAVASGRSCSTCNGSGQILRRFGGMQVHSTCSKCGGSGGEVSGCPNCNGQGYTNIQRNVDIKVRQK